MHKLFILMVLTLTACGKTADTATYAPTFTSAAATSISSSLPAGFTVVEQSSDGYFIRIASAERASSSMILKLADSLSDSFDRIDLCLDSTHERGDEYLAIIDGMIYDYEHNIIYALNAISK